MANAGSPTSLRSSDSSVAKHTVRHSVRNSERASYRLFPSVEPTPPASPISLHHRKRLTRPTELQGRRSSSLDDTVRLATARQNVSLKTVAVKRGRKVSITDVEPMSTVQESPIDSPTVPVRYSVLPRVSDDLAHFRASSAPIGECIRDSQTLPIQSVQPSDPTSKATWTSRQAQSHPLSFARGLGLSLPESNLERQPRRQGPSKPKPNLTIKVHNEQKPPPPPPKSPRHSRDPSGHSVVSSIHGDSPGSATAVTPGSIMKAALINTHGSPMPTPGLPLNAKQQTFFPPSGQVRLREVDLGRDRGRQAEPSQLQVPGQAPDRAAAVKILAPDVDKPMPSLPTPSSRFSAHLREVWEAEKSDGDKKMKGVAPATQPQNSAATDTDSTQSISSDLTEKNEDDASAQSVPRSLTSMSNNSSRDLRPPTSDLDGRVTPDLGSRPQSPANLLQTTSAGTKLLPILPTETGTRPRSATPESSSRLLKPSDAKLAPSDPIQTFQDLSKQCEALHVRYATLRAERVKLSTAISASLKEEKPGPDYANVLLDKHLALNAISSSMDICFAKLKSLDCRKEEAMATYMRQLKTKSMMGDERSSIFNRSPVASVFTTESGRSTPDFAREPKSLSPELAVPSRFSPNLPRTASPVRNTPETSLDARVSPKPDDRDLRDTKGPEKRTTVIRAPPIPDTTANSNEAPPASPISAISSIEDDKCKTKRIRIKGVKAAKILGLVAQSANGTPGSHGITLPDESPSLKSPKSKFASAAKQMEVEVEIKPRKSAERKSAERKRTPPASNLVPVPKRKPPPPPRQGTNDSVSSIAASSHTESSPEEPEVKTPRESQDTPLGLRSPKKGLLQTIQVFVDDDILDYYGGKSSPR